MSNAQNAFRSLFIYAILTPVALILGYFLATAGSYTDLKSLAPILLLFGLLTLPLLLKWHQQILLVTLNTAAVLFLFPGAPPVWFVMAGVSLVLALVQRALNREASFVHVPSIVWPLLYLAAVVFLTGCFTGGFGTRAFGGGQYGGRRYWLIFGAFATYFAIVSRAIPEHKAMLYVGLFFLGGLANLMSNLIPLLPKDFYWLAEIFPVTMNDMGLVSTQEQFGSGIARLLGLTAACFCVFCYMLARFGIREMLSGRNSWRFVVLLTVLMLSMLGGFRSALVILALTFFLVFYFEGLFRTAYAGILLGTLILAATVLVPFANKLPVSIQRTLSVLPLNLKIDPVARYDAEASSEWRLEMWSVLLPEVPKYLFKPKGMGIDGMDLELTGDLVRRGLASSQEVSMLAGDYHNGPLSILIPFGIWGLIGWLWFLAASIRALWMNYRHGPATLRKVNTLLLAYFLAKSIMFFFVFGGFYGEMVTFVSIIAIGVSLNNGICSPARQIDLRTETHPAEADMDIETVPMPSRS